MQARTRKFSQIVTIDIDQAYAFQHRGVTKNTVSFVKNLIRRKTDLLKAQVDLVLKKEKDPYDSYQYLQEVQTQTGIRFIYFVNVGEYSKYDKNLSTSNFAFKKLLADFILELKIGQGDLKDPTCLI